MLGLNPEQEKRLLNLHTQGLAEQWHQSPVSYSATEHLQTVPNAEGREGRAGKLYRPLLLRSGVGSSNISSSWNVTGPDSHWSQSWQGYQLGWEAGMGKEFALSG